MNEPTTPKEKLAAADALRLREGVIFRPFLGMICVLSGLAGIVGLYIIEIPSGNKDVLVLALGIVLGWGSAVVQSEYGATTTGRKIAESAVRNLETKEGEVK